jgi:hypothetical protein
MGITSPNRIVYSDTAWDDFLIVLNPGTQGATSKPDYDFTNLGLLFPQNDNTEIAYAVAQMSHSKLMDSDINLHIHYIQNSSDEPTFKIDYKFYLNGAAVPGSWTTISTADNDKALLTYSSGSIMQIGKFPAISPPSSETVSANLDIKLYRDDNDRTGDCLAKYVDFHYQIDQPGSNEEYTK